MPPPASSTLWRNRDFLLLWGGQAVSQVGSQVTILALPLVAIVLLHASTLQVGLLSATATSAYLLVSLPAGVVVDRMAKRTLMLAADVAQIVVIGSVPVAYAAGLLSLGQLYVVALAASVLDVFFLVAYTSYLPVLVAPEQLMDGNGKLSTTQSLAQIAGPGLGALLVGVAGAALAMGSDALSFAASAACLLAIRRREPRPSPAQAGAARTGAARTSPAQADLARTGGASRARFRADVAAGLRYVLHEPILRHTVAWNGSANFFVIMVETLGPLFLIRTVHLRPAYVGVLLALGAVGGVVAGVTAKPLIRRIGSARIAWVSMTVFTLPGLLIPLAGPGWWVLLFAAGWISWTFSATLCGIALVSYQQATCPPELRGRVSAAQRWINWGTLPLGSLTGGALGTAIGVHATLWLAVIGGCASGLWLYLSPLRGQRDLATGPAGNGGLRPATEAR